MDDANRRLVQVQYLVQEWVIRANHWKDGQGHHQVQG